MSAAAAAAAATTEAEDAASAEVLAAAIASLATFSGMHTDDQFTHAEAKRVAKEEAQENEEELDEVVQRLPIVLNHKLAHTTYLLQSTLRPAHRPYDIELGSRVSMKVKPIQKKIEMEYTLEDAGVNYQTDGGTLGDDIHAGHNYDHEHKYPQRKVTLQAKPVPPKTNYCAGVLSNGVLYLTPIHAVCRFKPSLNYVDAADQQALTDSELKKEQHKFERLREGRMTEEEEMEMEEEQFRKVKEEEGKKELQSVIMKVNKNRGGAGGAAGAAAGGAGGIGGISTAPGGGLRKQTYAYLKQIEDREEWISLKVHEQETPVTTEKFRDLLLRSTQDLPEIKFNVHAWDYLGYVNPPDLLDSSSSNQSMIATGDANLSLEDRIVYFMRTCRQINFGDFFKKLEIGKHIKAQGGTREERERVMRAAAEELERALNLLKDICWVVQGCLVLKSSIVYNRTWRPGMAVPHARDAVALITQRSSSKQAEIADRKQLCREYLLTQFYKHRIIYRDEVNAVMQLEWEVLDELLLEMATKNTQPRPDLRQKGIPTGGQWEWKLTSETVIEQNFPRCQLLVISNEQLAPIGVNQQSRLETDLLQLLITNTSHPARESATRHLHLSHTENIVHTLVPAGFASDRVAPPTRNLTATSVPQAASSR